MYVHNQDISSSGPLLSYNHSLTTSAAVRLFCSQIYDLPCRPFCSVKFSLHFFKLFDSRYEC